MVLVRHLEDGRDDLALLRVLDDGVPDLGREVLMRFYADLEELAKMEREPLQEARNRMAMVLAKKK